MSIDELVVASWNVKNNGAGAAAGTRKASQILADKGPITWDVNVDSTVCRAHQHAAGAAKRGTSRRNHPEGSSRSRRITASDAPGSG